jgi:hypothetical protein
MYLLGRQRLELFVAERRDLMRRMHRIVRLVRRQWIGRILLWIVGIVWIAIWIGHVRISILLMLHIRRKRWRIGIHRILRISFLITSILMLHYLFLL